MSGVALASVKARTRLGRVPFTLGLALLLVAGMVGLLALNIAIQSASSRLRSDQTTAKSLADEAAALQAEVDRAAAVGNLAQQAAALGMRPNPYAVFLILPDGTIVGTPKPVIGNELPAQAPGLSGPVAPPIQIKVYPLPTSTASPQTPADGPILPTDPTPSPTPTPTPTPAPTPTPTDEVN